MRQTQAKPDWRITPALGIVQILTWGSSFYLLAILGPAIIADTGWPPALVAGGVSVALVVAGLAAPSVGRLIARHGGRQVMMGGVLALSAGLAGLGFATGPVLYLCLWAWLGLTGAATLYDAAFSTLGQIFGKGARRAITALTLWGGFASTIFWPISALLVETIGWRGTCLSYAVMHLVVTWPLLRFGLPRLGADHGSQRPEAKPVALTPAQRPIFLLLALTGLCLSGVFSALAMHLIPLLQASGQTLTAAVAFGALIGPAQVAARLIEFVAGARFPATLTLGLSVTAVGFGVIGLTLGLWPAGALILYGLGTGLWSIARGTVTLALFGPEPYTMILARLARPFLLTSAAAPVIFAQLLDGVGPEAAQLVLAGVASLGFVAGWGTVWLAPRA